MHIPHGYVERELFANFISKNKKSPGGQFGFFLLKPKLKPSLTSAFTRDMLRPALRPQLDAQAGSSSSQALGGTLRPSTPMTRLFSKAGSFFFKSRVMHGFGVSEFSVFYLYGRASTLRCEVQRWGFAQWQGSKIINFSKGSEFLASAQWQAQRVGGRCAVRHAQRAPCDGSECDN